MLIDRCDPPQHWPPYSVLHSKKTLHFHELFCPTTLQKVCQTNGTEFVFFQTLDQADMNEQKSINFRLPLLGRPLGSFQVASGQHLGKLRATFVQPLGNLRVTSGQSLGNLLATFRQPLCSLCAASEQPLGNLQAASGQPFRQLWALWARATKNVKNPPE